MIASIQSVRLERAGFVVIWHVCGFPCSPRASVLSPAAMPEGHELLRAGADVDLTLSRDGRIVAVYPPLRPRCV